MIRSEISFSFFHIGGNILVDGDDFLEAIGLHQSDRERYLERWKQALKETSGELCEFGRRFRFRYQLHLDSSKKKYSSVLHCFTKPMDYVCIQTETFFLNAHIKNRVFKTWNDRLPDGWFLEIDNFKGFHKVYSGHLQLLKRYLFQDPGIPALDLPNLICFKSEKDWYQFTWVEPEIDVVENWLK
jgi:hypothetical protein